MILDGAYYCCTGPEALHGQVKWAWVQWLLGAEPDSWCSLDWLWSPNAGLAACWCELSLSPSAWGFFAVTVFTALENSMTSSHGCAEESAPQHEFKPL